MFKAKSMTSVKAVLKPLGVLLFSVISLGSHIGCVTTRAELRGDEGLSAANRRPVTVQQLRAQEALRDQEYQEQLRELHGRIENLEHQVQVGFRDKLQDLDSSQKAFIDARLKLYEEALANTEKQLSQILAELSELKKKRSHQR